MPVPRRFDHEEARRRYFSGESAASLASEYGVTVKAIRRLVSDKIAASEQRASTAYYERLRVPCETCGTPCLPATSRMKLPHNPDGRSLCQSCRSTERRERLRFDERGALVSVRCSMIDCANGERWQTPDRFTKGQRHREVREGGIHDCCRACQTRARARWRARNLERSKSYDREYAKQRRSS